MYIEHPFKYDGVYYAKVDGELIEITKEQAKVMLSFYRNYKNYDKKWGYRGEEDNDDENSEQKKKKEKEEIDSCKELMDELEQEEKEAEKKAAQAEAVQKKADKKADGKKEKKGSEPKKRKLVVPREIVLDCVFSENAFDLSVQDMPGENPQSTEAVVMKQLEYEELHEKVSMLSEQDQYIIREVFFKGLSQVEVARNMGVTPQNLHSRLKYALTRLRRLYIFGENL